MHSYFSLRIERISVYFSLIGKGLGRGLAGFWMVHIPLAFQVFLGGDDFMPPFVYSCKIMGRDRSLSGSNMKNNLIYNCFPSSLLSCRVIESGEVVRKPQGNHRSCAALLPSNPETEIKVL